MRLATTLFVSVLAACFLPFIAAVQHTHRPRSHHVTAKRATHGKSSSAQVIAQRQHHVHRDLIDLCLNLDVGVLAPILHILNPLAANVHLCLCIQDLDIFLDSDVGILLGSILGGKDSLLAKLKLLINTSPETASCTFPPHSHRLCVSGQPCAFDCEPPYVLDQKTCICPPPMIECNGICGNFPHGCSSAVPHRSRREISSITSYANAQKVCKTGHEVCGIPGREGTKDFECIDTRLSLDSCGGCVVQHGFSDGPASAPGTDCGRLPGVVSSYCSESRCVITQCRSGWHLDTKRGKCIKVTAGTVRRTARSRLNKTVKRGTLEIATVIDSELADRLNTYALLVVNLCNASQTLSTLPTGHPQTPPASGINHVYHTNAILEATIDALQSPTVVELFTNLDTVVNVNALVVDAFNECECAGSLGSLYDDLIVVFNASLALQNWCSTHTISTPADPTDTTVVPNTSGSPIEILLDDALRSLGVAWKKNRIDIFGLSDLNGSGPANVRRQSSPSSPAKLNPELLDKTRVLVDAVIALKNCEPHLPPAHPLDPATAVNDNLINAIVQAAANLLGSETVSTYVGNVDTIVAVNQLVTDILGSCECVDNLGIAALIDHLVAVTEATLAIQHWCSLNPVVSAPHTSTNPTPDPTAVAPTSSYIAAPASSTPVPPSPPNPHDHTAIIIDLDLNGILASLGLGPTDGGGLLELGGLLDGLSSPINIDAVTTTNLQINSALLVQIQGIAALALTIQNGSVALPAAPSNNPPILGVPPSGEVPVDTNLITGILQATLNLCTSGTVGDLLHNLQVLADVNNVTHSSLTGCSCVDLLGLSGLLTDVENLSVAVLNALTWCTTHPVVEPTDPHTSSFPLSTTISEHAPAPTQSSDPGASNLVNVAISLDLSDVVSALTVGLTANASSNANVTVELGGLLNALVTVVVQIQGHSTSLPSVPTTTSALPSTSVPASNPATTPLPLSQGLINDLVQAVADLLNLTINSTTTADLLVNVNGLLNLGGLLGDSIDNCECVSSLGIQALEDDVDLLLDALLALHLWCQHHQGGNGENGTTPPDTINIDAHDLLTALGVDMSVKGEVPGLGLSGIVNPLLQALGLGKVKRLMLH